MSEVNTLAVSSSPHIRSRRTTRSIMLDVIIALIPALVGGVVFFGWRAFLLTLVSASACVFFEWAYRRLMKLDCTVGDLSAIVTGILIAFVCPVSAPIWIIVIGDAFAIIFVKQLFGGIGQNYMNPALAARAFMLISWPVVLTGWAANRLETVVDAATYATPLSQTAKVQLIDLFLGRTGGCIGEVSAMLLLVGGLYLVIRRVISVRIPLSFLGTVALLAFVFPQNGCDRLYSMGFQLLSGGLMLAAIFMATDYVTSPVTHWGQILFGIGCGALTVFIRYFGSYPEGVSFAILLMNACVGIFDRIGRKKRFGTGKNGGAAK